MIQEIQYSIQQFYSGLELVIPECILIAGILFLILFKVIFKKENFFSGTFSSIIILVALLFSCFQFQNFQFSTQVFEGLLFVDLLVFGYKSFLLLISIFVLGIHRFEKNETKIEFDVLFLGACLSALLLISSSNLIMLFLCLEMFSLCSYALVASEMGEQLETESSLKYILFGLFSSALMLFGLSILYGITHTLDPNNIHFIAQISRANPALMIFVIGLCSCGFLFKISALPFHFYIPDTFQGTTYSLVAFLSTFSKITGFIILFRFIQFFEAGFFNFLQVEILTKWKLFIGLISLITLLWANLSALWQVNIKRLLAYSSIAQSGFILMSIFTFTDTGKIAFGFYAIAFCIANLGLIWSLSFFKNAIELKDISGFGKQYPILGIFITIFIVSLIGIPVSIGFNAKFAIFSAVFESYAISKQSIDLILLLTGIISTVLSLVYYIKIPYFLFFKTSRIQLVFNRYYFISYLAIILLGIAVLFFGVFPNAVLDLIKNTLYRI